MAKIASALADPLSVFDSRSPGERMAGILNQTKPSRVRPNLPRERVKSVVRDRPAVPVVRPIVRMPDVPGEPDVSLGPLGPRFPEVNPPPGPPPIGPVLPPQLSLGFDDKKIEDAIPEPATWMTMIVGLFAIGASARSRRAAALKRPARADDEARLTRIPPRS